MELLDRFEYLVLSGGGINGLSQLGALRAVQSSLPICFYNHFKGFAGTSIGAFIGVALSCGKTIDDLFNYFESAREDLGNIRVSLSKFLDTKGATGTFFPFDKVITEILPSETITFRQLFKKTQKHLVIVAFSLCKLKPRYFSYLETPDVNVKQALLASIAVPTILPPVVIGSDILVDGGLGINFPFSVFPEPKTFGVWLCETKHHTPDVAEILSSSSTYLKLLCKAMYLNYNIVFNEVLLTKLRPQIIVVPNLHFLPLPSNCSDQQLNKMQEHGFTAAFMHLYHFGQIPPSLLDYVIFQGFCAKVS